MPLWGRKKKEGERPGDWERDDPFDDPFFSMRDDLFRDMDEQMRKMQAYMNSMMERTASGELRTERNGGPYVYGWSMRVGPDGVPHVQRFGNVRDEKLPPGLKAGAPARTEPEGTPRLRRLEVSEGSEAERGTEGEAEGECAEGAECSTCGTDRLAGPGVREPLTDVCQDDRNIVITVEMPGIDRDSIELETSDESMVIKVEKGNRKYYKDVKLPARVKPNTAKAKYNNGVLDITVEKEETKKAGTKVKVE